MWYNICVADNDLIPWEPQYPYVPTNQNKRRVLSYLVLGHSLVEALDLAGIKERAFYLWKSRDKDFAYWASLGLEQLRREKRDDIVGANHLRIAHMVQQDTMLQVAHIMKIPQNLRTREQNKYMRDVMATYGSATQMKAIREFVENGQLEEASKVSVFEKLAAARKDIVDGEFKEVADGVSEVQTTDGKETIPNRG